ncbi:MAG TPA: hypothetical protein VJ810_39230, partial [Blastocatellia bacterium]|nr:hypothetical protein [Blastocatellia bacterium]
EIYCLLDSAPLFDNEEFGESVIVLHRFGGTYGPAMFLLTANPLEMSEPNGAITLTLANRQLMPLQVFKLDKIRVSANAVPSLETVPVIRQQVDSGTVNVDLNEKPGDPMIEPMEVDDLIVFNGIDATTGDYLIQPIKLSDVARIAIDSPQDKNLINAIINAKRQAEVKHL